MKNTYKPGQLITAYGHIYRIVKRSKYPMTIICHGKLTTIEKMEPCYLGCEVKNCTDICSKYCIPSAYHRHIPHDCYFKLVK